MSRHNASVIFSWSRSLRRCVTHATHRLFSPPQSLSSDLRPIAFVFCQSPLYCHINPVNMEADCKPPYSQLFRDNSSKSQSFFIVRVAIDSQPHTSPLNPTSRQFTALHTQSALRRGLGPQTRGLRSEKGFRPEPYHSLSPLYTPSQAPLRLYIVGSSRCNFCLKIIDHGNKDLFL